MKKDEILFIDYIIETEPHKNPKKFDNKKFKLNKQWIFIFIFFALIFMATMGYLILRKDFEPVQYFTDVDGCLCRIVGSNKPTRLLESDYKVLNIVKSPNNDDVYIVAWKNKISAQSTGEKQYLFYLNNKSDPMLVMEGEIFEVFYKGNNAFLHGTDKTSGIASANYYNLYSLDKNEIKFLADNVIYFSFREDGKGFSYINNDFKLFSFTENNLKSIDLKNDKVQYIYNSPYSDDVYINIYNGPVDNGSRFVKYTKGKGLETILSNTVVKIDFTQDKAYFLDDGATLYSYSSKGAEKISEKCADFILLSDVNELLYQQDSTVYYINKEGHTSKLFRIPSHKYGPLVPSVFYNFIADHKNKKFYYIYEEKLYQGDIISIDYPEVTCLSRDATIVVSDNGQKINGYRRKNDIVYGYLTHLEFVPLYGKGNKEQVNNIYLYNYVTEFNEGIALLGRDKLTDDDYNLYFMKQGKAPKLLDSHILELNTSNDYIDYDRKIDYVTYTKKSKANPDKTELYATNGSKTILMCSDYKSVRSY